MTEKPGHSTFELPRDDRETDFERLANLLIDNCEWGFWGKDSQLKYLTIHIDTRSNRYILKDRDGNRISPDRVASAIERWHAWLKK